MQMKNKMTDLRKIFHSFGISDLLNASTSGLLLFKEDRQHEGDTIRYVCTVDNASACAMTGIGSLTGKDWQEIIGISPMGDSLNTEDCEVYIKSTNKWCRVSNVPIDEHHFMCTLTDITPRKQLQERENDIANILKHAEQTMQFGSWVCDLDNHKSDWSAGIFDLLGYTPEQAAGLQPSYELFLKHIHPDDIDNVDEVIQQSLLSQKAFDITYRATTATGEDKYFISRGQYWHPTDNRPATSIGSMFDITSITNIQNELEKKVAELNRSNLDLEQFAYVASHDLQEPLRKIVSFGERLEHKSQGLLNEEMGLYLDRILNATRRMQEMINNLLEFSRVARAKDGFTSTDLNTVIKSTMSDMEIAIQQKGALLKMSSLPIIEAIPSQMSQLFLNLFSNSLKFARDEIQPEIVIKSDILDRADTIGYGLPSSRQYVRITFGDNGIGFENNDSSRIFTLFQRLRGRSEYEGAGIGLAVCKKVVDNHSGIIMASGKPNIGSVFTIVLPLKQS
jgi:PAS domain S-box-containing protein